MPWESNHRLWNNPEALLLWWFRPIHHLKGKTSLPSPLPKSQSSSHLLTPNSLHHLILINMQRLSSGALSKISWRTLILPGQTACQREWKRKLKIKICLYFPKGKPLIKKRHRVIPESPFRSTPCDAQANSLIPILRSMLMRNKKGFTILPKAPRFHLCKHVYFFCLFTFNTSTFIYLKLNRFRFIIQNNFQST